MSAGLDCNERRRLRQRRQITLEGHPGKVQGVRLEHRRREWRSAQCHENVTFSIDVACSSEAHNTKQSEAKHLLYFCISTYLPA